MWDFFKRLGQRRSQGTSQRHNSREYDQHDLFVPSFQCRSQFYGSSGLYLPVLMNFSYQFSDNTFHPHIPKCLRTISCSELLMGNRVEDYFSCVSPGSQNDDSNCSYIEAQNDYSSYRNGVGTVSGARISSLLNLEEEEEDTSNTNGYTPVIEAPPNGFPGEFPPSYEEAMGLAGQWSDRLSWCFTDSEIAFFTQN